MAKVIGVFNDRKQAERAVGEIRRAGITDEKISIAGKEESLRDVRDNNQGRMQGEDVTTGATAGGTIGGLAGILAGAGTLAIPGIGPILAAGPLAAGLGGAAAGGLTGSLVDLGIPRERGEHFENEVKRGRLLAVVETDENKVDEVSQHLRNNGAQNVEKH
ncbi:MAG: general stress protein [Halanaerobiales bacterium]